MLQVPKESVKRKAEKSIKGEVEFDCYATNLSAIILSFRIYGILTMSVPVYNCISVS